MMLNGTSSSAASAEPSTSPSPVASQAQQILLAKCVCVADVEREALEILPRSVRDYYKSGADDEVTLARNIRAMQRYLVRPLALRDVSKLNPSVRVVLRAPSTSVRTFDHTLPYPIAFAPSAFHRMAHNDGEEATVKAAGETGSLMILSTLSTTSLEDVAKAAPPGTHYWFQLYVYKNRKLTESLVQRAVDAGYSALVLTVDAPTMARRRADERNGFDLPAHLRMANFETETFAKMQDGQVGTSGLSRYTLSLFDASLDWKDLEWLVNFSPVPVIVKGIMRPDDAERAIAAGAAGIVISNHGGRQMDHAPSTIEALAEIAPVIKGRCAIFMDGGIRTGTDVFKAIALGANTVLLGRPIVYGLAIGGKEGVKHVVNLLRREFDYAMILSGCASIREIRENEQMVVQERYYSKL